jgi:hypothetical protein
VSPEVKTKDTATPDGTAGKINSQPNGQDVVGPQNQPTDASKTGIGQTEGGLAAILSTAATAADHTQALGAEKTRLAQAASKDLPALEVQQDGLTVQYGKGGSIQQITDGDGNWTSTDGVHFFQPGNNNTRTLSKDQDGHLIFVDQKMIDKETQRIDQDLKELHQIFKGRGQSQCERDLRNALADKSPAEIKALDNSYYSQCHKSLYDTIRQDSKLTAATREALGLYWKGAPQRSDADVLKLADTALTYRNINLFEEAMRDASPAARQKFVADSGAQRVYTAFTESQVDSKSGHVTTTETASLARANDYMYYGKLSVATQVRDNKGKEAAIETAIASMSDGERKTYLLGKAISAGNPALKNVSEADQTTAKQYYQNTRAAFDRAGNHTEVALWEGLIASPDSGTLAKLASHRGWLYNDSTGTVAGDVEHMNSHDAALLQNKVTGPHYKAQIDNVLTSYLKDGDAKRVMAVVERKAQPDTTTGASDAGRRPVLDSMLDSVHYFRSNDQGLMVKSLVEMSASEQAAYRNDTRFRQQLDQAVNRHMSGPGKDAAHYVLANTLADKDGKNSKAERREDIVVRLYEHAMNDPGPDRKDAVRDLQTALNNDSSLRDRINNPKTGQDNAFAVEFHKAADCALHYRAVTGRLVTTMGPEEYLNPILSTGHITTSLAKHLSTGDDLRLDTVTFTQDMQNISPEEKQKLLVDSTYRDVTLSGLTEAQKAVVLCTLNQGKVNPEDQLRAAVIDGNSASIMETLRSIKLPDLPGVEKSYVDKKYGASMAVQIAKPLSGVEKAQAGQIFEQIHEDVPEQAIASQTRASHARSGIGSDITEALGYGTGPQLDDSINRTVHARVEAAQAGRHLTDAELQNKINDNYTNIDNFLKDRQSAADTVTNISTVAGTVGLTVATAGATLPMLASGVAFGAGCRIAAQKLVMGENYDATIENLSKDAMLGGLTGAAMALTPELLMGTGQAAADLASAEILQGAAGQALSVEGKQVLQTGMRTLVQDALKSGADNVADGDIEALAVKAGNPHLSADMKAALPKAYKNEFDKVTADGLHALKANSMAGAAGGGISAAGSEALNGDPRQSAGERTKKIVTAGLIGAGQGAITGAVVGGIAEGLKAGLKTGAEPGELPRVSAGEANSEGLLAPKSAPESAPEVRPVLAEPEAAIAASQPSAAEVAHTAAPVIERSPTTGQIVSTTDARGVKAEYTWGERDGQQVLTRVKHNGVEEELTGPGHWKETKGRVIDDYEESGETRTGTRALDSDGNLIRTDEQDPITKQIKYLLDGSTERELQSGGTILAQRDGLPMQVIDAKGNKFTYAWDSSAAQPDLHGVKIEAKDGSGTTQLTKTASGWQATSTGQPLLPANAKISGISVEGGGAELKISLDTKVPDSTLQSVSCFSDGTIAGVPRSTGALDTAQAVASKLLKDGKLEIEDSKVEGGLLKIVRYGTVSDGQGNDLRVFVRPLNDPSDATAIFRVRQTQIARDLHAIDGDTGGSPNIVVRDVMLDGKLTTVAIQPDQGENFLSQLRRWTAESKGLKVKDVKTDELMKQVSSQDMADFVKSNHAVYKAVGTAYAHRMADGGMDFQGSNWTIQESIGGKPVSFDQPLHLTDIDSKRSYTTDKTATFGRGMDWGDQAVLADKDFANVRLSDIDPKLQQEMERRLQIEESAQGQKAMAQAGLSEAQIAGRIARTRYLVEHGFPPAPGTQSPLLPELYDLPEGYDERLDKLEKQLLADGKKARLDDTLKHNDTLPADRSGGSQ